MNLGLFITENMESILQEWQEYANSLKQGKLLSKVELRDHAKVMLQSMVKDLSAPQSKKQELKKSKGHSGYLSEHSKLINDTAGQHALDRVDSGFTIQDLVSEFRSLRASVLRLWEKSPEATQVSDLHDMTRFNESIDQALAESVDVYANQKERNIRLFETILFSSPDHNYILDLDAKFLYANKAMAEQCGKDAELMMGKNIVELGLVEVLEVQQAVNKVIHDKVPVRGEIRYRTKSGKTTFYEYILTPIFDPNKKVEAIAGTERDITDRKSSEEAVWYKANYDHLTELPNRSLFRDRLDQQVMLSERTGNLAALFFIDLDNFKEANDTLGHDAGDELLKQAANRIRSCIRQNDTVARIGGDEFTVILTDFNKINHVKKIATKVLKELAKPFQISGEQVSISGSIGIALVPEDATSSEHLISNADQAMYMAKNDGRNNFRFFLKPSGSKSHQAA
ncbi:MAG: diguanylate cyclase [Methylophilus sp.]|nr:diguanylate cyclase [Methylophilus sp.]